MLVERARATRDGFADALPREGAPRPDPDAAAAAVAGAGAEVCEIETLDM